MTTMQDLVGKVINFTFKDRKYSSSRITPRDHSGVLIGEDDHFIDVDHVLEEALGSKDYHWSYQGRKYFNKNDISDLQPSNKKPEEYVADIRNIGHGIHFHAPRPSSLQHSLSGAVGEGE